MDEAARAHDSFYLRHKDTESRHIADKVLENSALKRVVSKDASIGERGAALLTAGAMRIKRKLGMGLQAPRVRRDRKKKKKKKTKLGSGITFNGLVKKARAGMKRLGKNASPNDVASMALTTIRPIAKKKKVKVPRIIPIPKTGGAFPLIPILAGISAVSGAATGVGSIVKAVSDIIEAKRKIFPGETKKIGNGLYLAPYKKNGFGLYLQPYFKKPKKN